MGSIWFSCLCLVSCSVLFSQNFDVCEAVEFVVGGKENTWRIPVASNALNMWAEKERFKIGDSLVFKYNSKTDSVLRVEEGDYSRCNKTKPIEEYRDGNTVFKINESGSFFFISGADGHCEKGEKLEVKVLSHRHSSPPPALSPKYSPATVPPPVLAPAESPKSSSVGSNLRISIYVSAIAVVTMVGIVMI